MKLNTIYSALVPAWLATALYRRQLSLDVVTDLGQLENTLSLDDVCFYVSYLQNAQHYVGDIFNDMQCITTLPHNAAWIIKNQNKIANTKSQVQSFIQNGNLVGNQVPISVRKTNYVAKALPELSVLAVVGQDTLDPLNSAQLIDQCVSELAKLTTNDQIFQSSVFKAFTQTAA